MRRPFSLILFLGLSLMASGSRKVIDVNVANKSGKDRMATPVVVSLKNCGFGVASATVSVGGEVLPYQLDDLDDDGVNDELCFLTDIPAKGRKAFKVELSSDPQTSFFKPEVYAEMLLTNKKIKSSNKQDLYISSLTVDNGTNPYWMLHHHGPAFENDMVAYRIYFDHRQTVDIYGKYRKGLELKETQFYPDKSQKAAGYGDDVLWVGETFGLGAIRGWDGSKTAMLSDVDKRTLRIVSRGPLRTIVEVEDKGWNTKNPGLDRVDMVQRFILYARRRDCFVEVSFDKDVSGYKFTTGIINVKNSVELTDKKGLRGCWGTDWPVSEKDSVGHKRETVGLGIKIPAGSIASEMPADKDNYPYVISPKGKAFKFNITFASANESFGYGSSEEWFDYLKAWRDEIDSPVEIVVK